MSPWLLAVDYPPTQSGYWGPVTSTLNWCEEDYYATVYSAEIVNTLTNLLFITFAVKGIINCLKNGHDQIFLVAFIGYGLVGTGSFLFHATLKYPMQLVDELSMIYTTCLMNYASFSHLRSRNFRIALGVGLVSLAIAITLYYHYLQDPVFHQNAYAILTAVVLLRSMYIMEVRLRPSGRKQDTRTGVPKPEVVGNKGSLSTEDQADTKILATMWLLIACGLSTFLGGFFIWTLDNKYCTTLIGWRRHIGLPWGVVLEGHGWWHLMTGTGAYFYIVWGIWLRHCLNGRQEDYRLLWPSIFTSLPQVVRVDGTNRGADDKKSR